MPAVDAALQSNLRRSFSLFFQVLVIFFRDFGIITYGNLSDDAVDLKVIGDRRKFGILVALIPQPYKLRSLNVEHSMTGC